MTLYQFEQRQKMQLGNLLNKCLTQPHKPLNTEPEVTSQIQIHNLLMRNWSLVHEHGNYIVELHTGKPWLVVEVTMKRTSDKIAQHYCLGH